VIVRAIVGLASDSSLVSVIYYAEEHIRSYVYKGRNKSGGIIGSLVAQWLGCLACILEAWV